MQIGSTGGEALGRMFESNSFLWRLSLRDNSLGAAGVQGLVPTAYLACVLSATQKNDTARARAVAICFLAGASDVTTVNCIPL
jgi:hypothetical protein